VHVCEICLFLFVSIGVCLFVCEFRVTMCDLFVLCVWISANIEVSQGVFFFCLREYPLPSPRWGPLPHPPRVQKGLEGREEVRLGLRGRGRRPSILVEEEVAGPPSWRPC
jgi:hypothetical protein